MYEQVVDPVSGVVLGYRVVDAAGNVRFVPTVAGATDAASAPPQPPPVPAMTAMAGMGPWGPTEYVDAARAQRAARQAAREAAAAEPLPTAPQQVPPGFGSGEPPRPTYADGRLHPAWGGQPYQFPQSSGAADRSRRMQTNTGSLKIGSGYMGGSSSGGSGGGNDLYWSLRNKLLGAMTGGSGYGSSGSSYEPLKPEPTYNEKVRGWAGQRNYKAETLNDLIYANPGFVLDDLTPQYADSSTFGRQMLDDLPVADLTMLTYGAKNGWRGAPWLTKRATKFQDRHVNEYGYPTKNLPSGLKTNPGQFTNSLANMYEKAATTANWFDRDKLLANLQRPGKNSALGALFNRKADPSTALGYYRGYLGSIFDTTMDPEMAQSAMGYANDLISQWGSTALRKKNPVPINRWVGRRLDF